MAEFESRVFLVSMACTGNPYENAMMHSFLKIPKHEEVYLCRYDTFHDMVTRLPCSPEEIEIGRDFIQCSVTTHPTNLR